IPEGVDFAAVFPMTPPAFKTITSTGSFISSTAFLTEFASVTSPIIISKIFLPVFSSRSFFAASALARFLQKRITFFVSFFNANCRAVSFPSPIFAPVINILSFIFSILFRLLMSGRFLYPSQAAPGDDDLAVALGGEQAGCRKADPGSGAGDESDRMFHGRLRGEG